MDSYTSEAAPASSVPAITVQPATNPPVMDDSASEHGSLADSSYDIISHSGTIDDDLGVTEGASTSSFPNSRAHTPALPSNIDEDEDFQHLSLNTSVPKIEHESQDLDDTPLASLRLPHPDTSSIHLPQSETLLQLNRPFRIRYLGVPADRDAVVGKIAQALALSCPAGDMEESALRYSVSQLSSFGAEKEAPQVELVPHSGIEIVLESHDVPAAGRKPGDTTVTGKRSVSQPGKPDLLVFVHDSRASDCLLDDGTMDVSRVPLLHLCESITESPGVSLGNNDLHLRVNGKNTLADVQHFLELDAAALNRHITHLVLLASPPLTSKKAESLLGTVQDLSRYVQRIMAGLDSPRQVIAALLVIGILTSGILTSLAVTNQFKSLPDETGFSSLQVSQETVSRSATGEPTAMESHTQGVPVQSEWFEMRAPSMTTLSQSAVIALDTKQSHAQDDPPVELIHVKDWLYYLKMPNELAKYRRLPQLKVTASSEGKPVDSSLAKWNGTVYSLELQPSPGSGPIDVFVSFAKGNRVYTYKIQPASTWLAMKRLHSWVDQKSIESGIAACMATTKELSRMAGKEVSLFRDQANGLVISSSDWLKKAVGGMRKSSGSTAVELWRNFELQTTAVTKALQVYNRDLSKSVSKRVTSISGALGRQTLGFAVSTGRVQRDLKRAHKAMEQQIGLLQRQMQGLRFSHTEGLKVIGAAQARAKAMAEEFGGLIRQRGSPLGSHENAKQTLHKSKKAKSCKRPEKGW